MDKRDKSYDVTINEKVYRLNKLDARTGTWLFSLLVGKADPQGSGATRQDLVTAFHLLSREDFDRVQNELLKNVFHVELNDGKEFTSSIIAANGKVSFDFVDVTVLYQLTDLQVVFNVEPFFPE